MWGYWQESYWAMSLGLSCVDLIENCGDLPPSSAALRFTGRNPRRINQTRKNCLQWQGCMGWDWGCIWVNLSGRKDQIVIMLALHSIALSCQRHGCNLSESFTLQTELFQPEKTHFAKVWSTRSEYLAFWVRTLSVNACERKYSALFATSHTGANDRQFVFPFLTGKRI